MIEHYLKNIACVVSSVYNNRSASSLEFLCHDNEWWCKMIIFAFQIITFISYFVKK